MSADNNGAADLLARILDEVEVESTPKPASAVADPAETHVKGASGNGAPVTGASSGGSLLGGLAADPALLSSVLPALLSAFPQGGGKSASAETGAGTGSAGGSSPPKGRPYPLDRHTALLCAVKPYLGERRQATAETVLRLCRLWDALSRAGLSPSMLNGLLGGGTPPAQSGESHHREVD